MQIYSKTSADYGKLPNVELEKVNKYNITINKELMPQPRHLAKGWKKPKWTAPADPFPELSGKLPPRGGAKKAAKADDG